MRTKSYALLLILALLAASTAVAQSTRSAGRISALALYQAFRQGKAAPFEKKVMQITGIATAVGPDPYALPSVELAESKGSHSRVLCVLPFTDYLKLRHVSKGDQVVMQGEVRGYSKEHGYVVVKECVILTVNGKKP